jgi:hypothetical protein
MEFLMANTCREAVEEVFRENSGPLTKLQVIQFIYKRYPTKPWKTNTIGDHLYGLSVNHPSGKHHPGLQKHAFLFFLGNGRYRLLDDQNESDITAQPQKIEPLDFKPGEESTEVDNIIEFETENLESKKINENQWMTIVLKHINHELSQKGYKNLVASQGAKLPYAFEILSYEDNTPKQRYNIAYETDILISEVMESGDWKPRIVIEGKLGSVTTHDAITYSQKALTHKNVHPYLRYGIILGNRKHHPLPGRLFRHGAYFDFMLSWRSIEPSDTELDYLSYLITEEVEASRNLDEILYNSRDPNRPKYTLLHRPLKLK